MRHPSWTIPVLVLGLVLIIVGPVAVSLIFPEEAAWTDRDAAALSQAGADLHAATHAAGGHDHAHGNSARDPSPGHKADQPAPDLAAAEAAYKTQAGRLDRALARRNWLGYGLRGLGVLLAAAGVASYVHSRRAA